MIRFTHRGSFDNNERKLNRLKRKDYRPILQRYASVGVEALRAATPVESGETRNSWGYEIIQTRNGVRIYWTNTHENQGVPIVILLQYGHGTRSGTFVEGRDFINPSMRSIFDDIAENLWKEVTAP